VLCRLLHVWFCVCNSTTHTAFHYYIYFPHSLACRGPGGPAVSAKGGSARVTWIGTSRLLQFVRQVIEGVPGVLTKSVLKRDLESGVMGAGFGRRPDAHENSKKERPPARVDRHYGNDRPVKSRYDQNTGDFSSGSTRKFHRSGAESGASVTRNREENRTDSGQKFARNRRSLVSTQQQPASSPSASKARSEERLSSQRWRGVERGSPRFTSESAVESRADKPGQTTKQAFSGKHETSSRKQEVFGGRRNSRGGIAVPALTKSSKKHKLRRPSLSYGRTRRE
jgi:hypothetical protein